jgi:hypothetical protein
MKKKWLLSALILPLSCSESPTTRITDEESKCSDEAFVRFVPALAGQDTEYSITVSPDLGVAKVEFEVPFTCDVRTGIVPDRRSSCTSVPREQYGDVRIDEVSPPLLQFEGKWIMGQDSEDCTGVRWGYPSRYADVTVRRAGEVLFDGTVTFLKKTCNNGVRDIEFQEAVVDVSDSGMGGAGGSE